MRSGPAAGGHADRERRGDAGGRRERAAHRLPDPAGEAQRVGQPVDRVGDDHELVAAEAADDVARHGPPRGRGRRCPCSTSSPTAWPWWSLIALKPSMSTKSTATCSSGPDGRDRVGEAPHDGRAVRQPGEPVVVGLLVEVAAQLLPVLHRLGEAVERGVERRAEAARQQRRRPGTSERSPLAMASTWRSAERMLADAPLSASAATLTSAGPRTGAGRSRSPPFMAVALAEIPSSELHHPPADDHRDGDGHAARRPARARTTWSRVSSALRVMLLAGRGQVGAR